MGGIGALPHPAHLFCYRVLQIVSYTYDAGQYGYNRLSSTSYVLVCATGQSATETYSYNAPGAVTNKQLSVPNGIALNAGYTYDTAGRTLSTTYPGVGSLTYAYDSMGRPVALVDMETPH